MHKIVVMLGDASSTITGGATAACNGACNTGSTVGGILAGVANALVFLVGGVSVIMVIIGGLRYVLSNGDSKAAESAKNTILYAVIGVVAAVAAYAIINFVVTNIK